MLWGRVCACVRVHFFCAFLWHHVCDYTDLLKWLMWRSNGFVSSLGSLLPHISTQRSIFNFRGGNVKGKERKYKCKCNGEPRSRKQSCRAKKNKHYICWVCVYSLRNLACNAHAPYCHLWPARLCNIFPHYVANGTIFEKQLLNTKCVLIFSSTFVWNISHYKEN